MAESPPARSAPSSLDDLQAFLAVTTGGVLARCIGALADLGVADVLGDSPESAEELAQRVGANPTILARIMRFVAAQGFFAIADGSFRHNARSRLLRADHPMSTGALMRVNADTWPLLSALDHTLRTGCPAAERVVGGSYWSYLATHRDVAKRFDEAMTSKAFGQIASLMPVYDFSSLGSIADVGGGRGHFIMSILAAYPQITGVLFDLPQVIDSLEEPTTPRLKLQAGNFFSDNVPPCDALLLMNVLHDWNDEECIAILSNLRRQAGPATKLLVAEAPLPEVDGSPHPALMLDIIMMVYATGRERKLSEYKKLFNASGWRLDHMIDSGTGMGMAMLQSSPA